MKYANKLKLKKLGYSLLGICTNLIILGIAWLQDKLIEIIISMITFYIFMPLYEKRYHCKTLTLCSFVSIIVFAVVANISVELTTSILISVILTFGVTSLSYFIRDYIDNKVLINEYRNKLNKINYKVLENLTEEEMIEKLPRIRYEIIHIVYDYIHRPPTKQAYYYARKYSISEATLYRYLKLVKETYESLGN